jgi:hypothetical protein
MRYDANKLRKERKQRKKFLERTTASHEKLVADFEKYKEAKLKQNKTYHSIPNATTHLVLLFRLFCENEPYSNKSKDALLKALEPLKVEKTTVDNKFDRFKQKLAVMKTELETLKEEFGVEDADGGTGKEGNGGGTGGGTGSNDDARDAAGNDGSDQGQVVAHSGNDMAVDS